MQVENVVREFVYNGARLPDPDPKRSLEQVRAIHSAVYPAIATAEIQGPEQRGNKMVYTYRASVTTKG